MPQSIWHILMRMLYSISVLWGIVTLLFVVFSIMEDPAEHYAGQNVDQATIHSIRQDLGLDKPYLERYWQYMADVSPINFAVTNESIDKWHSVVWIDFSPVCVIKLPYLRRSFQYDRPVTELIHEKFSATALLAFTALIPAVLLGLILGIVAAWFAGTSVDTVLVTVAAAGTSVPAFLVAVAGIWLILRWLPGYIPVTGYVVQENIIQEGTHYAWAHLVLPACTLAIRPLSILMQLTRDGTIEVLGSDYVRTARAKGLTDWQLVIRHVVRNTLNPVLTALSGWIAALITGAFFVEYIFDWQGLGKLTVDAFYAGDQPLLLGCCLFTGLIFMFTAGLTDALVTFLDPRIHKKA